MDSSGALHDSGLRDSRLLSRLLRVGIVVLDEAQRCRNASRLACELLGATDEDALCTGWAAVRLQLPLSEMAAVTENDPPLLRRVDLHTAAGTRLLRIEVHAISGEGHLMLLRDRGRLDDADRVLLAASEAQANRHVLNGLVHEAKGPLNNFHLTLALLATVLARAEGPAGAETARARWQRYVDVLQTEATRLVRCLDDIGALAQPGDSGRVRVDMNVVARDTTRLLRHEATIREASIELDVEPSPVYVRGDIRQLRLALLGITATVLDATQAGGVISVHVQPAQASVGPRVRVEASPATLPYALDADLFRLGCTPESRYAAAIAARIILEAHGGDVTLQHESPTRSGITIDFGTPPGDDTIAA